MAKKKYDFGGYATRYNVLCADGRIIKPGAFRGINGKTLPLVWKHGHENMEDVIGHCLMEDRPDGIYTYGSINEDVEQGKMAKALVSHGDLKSLSIFANGLSEKKTSSGKEVMHGTMREVSLVLSGANSGAYIDTLALYHDAEDVNPENFEGIIYSEDEIESGVEVEIAHSEDSSKDEKEEPKKEEKTVANEKHEETVQDVLDTLDEKQKKVVEYLLEKAHEMGSEDNKEEEDVKHNAFDTEYDKNSDALMHDAMNAIIGDAKRYGSLKDSYLAHADEYGITDIDWLFPDYQNITDKPEFIRTKPVDWVKTVMGGVHHTPFSRIKMMYADITGDDARALGYVKGNLKKEEVFSLLKRTVDPQTVYKKQKLDRDDVIDITDFDVVSWIKGEMREKLDEELARAFIFGDGRSSSSEDKIQESHIIPIYNDSELYTIPYDVTVADDEKFAHAFINASVTAQDDYQGSGNTTLFVANTVVTKLLLFEDFNGRRIYKTMQELALGLNVNSICKVPASIIPDGVLGVIVDLGDYTVGADKGGAINMFDDFDIDYNQMKYLIETRCSAALTKPYSAICLKGTVADGSEVTTSNFSNKTSSGS